MRIATWNVDRVQSTPRRTRVVSEIARIDADIWVLTETDDAVRPVGAYQSVATSPREGPGRPDERWTAIWSRLPIESLGPTSDPSRAVAALVSPAHGPALIVYGTVLPWLGSPWGSEPSAGGCAFAAALDAQRRDWDALRQRCPGAELVVAGDFNQDLSNPHYYGSARNRKELRAALTSAGLVALTGDPNDPVRARNDDFASVDHICVQSGSTSFTRRTLTIWPEGLAPDRRISDHFGVVVSSS